MHHCPPALVANHAAHPAAGYPQSEDTFYVEAEVGQALWCNAVNEFIFEQPGLTLSALLQRWVSPLLTNGPVHARTSIHNRLWLPRWQLPFIYILHFHARTYTHAHTCIYIYSRTQKCIRKHVPPQEHEPTSSCFTLSLYCP